MNQNRNSNRRRGRGSNRGGPGGGGIQGNRIDSRARGNAPQMLEKYRKLAHDASLNGDRVQTEYYLQFADHYFRVVADSRTPKDEQRPRQDERDQSSSYDDGYDSDERDERDEAPQGQPARGRGEHEDRGPRGEGARATEGDETDNSTGEDNPSTREARGSQERSGQGSGQSSGQSSGQRAAPRPRGRGRAAADARPAADDRAGLEPNNREPEERTVGNNDASFDPGLLPPSIPRDEEPKPRPARARRSARPAVDGDDEALEAVS